MAKEKNLTPVHKDFWLERINPNTGLNYTIEEAEEKANSIKPKYSPFSIQYWMEKVNPETGNLYTESEADFKRRSLRKNDKCYWLLQINPETGQKYTLEEAKKKAEDFHRQISIKGSHQALANGTLQKHPEKRSNRIEYYLAKGMSYEDAEKALKERQSTFSKEKCIKKYGKEKGEEIWLERQNKWLNSLNSKSDKEKDIINKKKSQIYRYSLKETTAEEKQKILEQYKNNGYQIFDNEEEFIIFIKKDYIESKSNYYKSPLDYLKTFAKLNYVIFNRTPKYYVKYIKDEDKHSQVLKSPSGYYTKQTPLGLLRSGFEIAMYDIIQELGLKLEAIDKPYPNSTLRFDFKVEGKYIELCGNMKDEKYRANMFYKRNTFGSILVSWKDDFKQFFIDYFIKKDNERIDYYNRRPL